MAETSPKHTHRTACSAADLKQVYDRSRNNLSDGMNEALKMESVVRRSYTHAEPYQNPRPSGIWEEVAR